ncbi:hypothetical protein CB1_000228010 [Camelus ferus]|nr:hypothetical protein CB1_000228010 [Camelus ferus]
MIADHLGCDPQTRFFVPPNIKQWIALLQRGNCTFKEKIQWIALLQRGNCTFKEKISRAAFHNAVAVVIYNNKSKEEPVTMTHPELKYVSQIAEGNQKEIKGQSDFAEPRCETLDSRQWFAA